MEPVEKKRIYVSNDDPSEEIHISKRPKITLNEELKRKCLKALCTTFWCLMSDCSLDVENVHVSSQMANVIRSCFTVHRQESLGENDFKEKHKDKAFTITSLGRSYNIQRTPTLNRVKDIFSWYGLNFTRPAANQKDHWYGTIAPYLSLCCAFEARLKEVRTGVQYFTKSKKDGQERAARVADFGFGPEHHILLEGVTYPPELASSMAQSLGALTICIRLCNESKTSKYGGKWKAAFSRAFAHVKECPELCLALAGKPASEASVLLGPLADLSLLVPPRTQRRACFPINMLSMVVLNEDERAHYSGTKKDGAYVPCAGLMEVMGDEAGWNLGKEVVDNITMSGKGAFLLYHAALDSHLMKGTTRSAVDFKYPGREEHRDSIVQGIFHGIWGTHLEDLSLLSLITNKNSDWKTRKEMGEFLVKTGTITTTVSLSSLPRYNMYSKLCSANVTKLLTESKGQISSNPVFSGRRVQTYKEELLEVLKNRLKDTGSSTKDLLSLAAIMREKVNAVSRMVEESGLKVEMGTVDWKKIEGATWAKGIDGRDSVEPGPLSGRYFLA